MKIRLRQALARCRQCGESAVDKAEKTRTVATIVARPAKP